MPAPEPNMLAILPWIALLGCAEEAAPEDDGDPCAPPGEPTLEIGLGMNGFQPLDEEDPFPLVHGPQGGYHLEIGLRATNLATDELVEGHLVGEIDGEVLAESLPWLDLRCMLPDAPVLESYGTLLIYDAQAEDLDGSTTTIRAEVTDRHGTTVAATASFVIDDTP